MTKLNGMQFRTFSEQIVAWTNVTERELKKLRTSFEKNLRNIEHLNLDVKDYDDMISREYLVLVSEDTSDLNQNKMSDLVVLREWHIHFIENLELLETLCKPTYQEVEKCLTNRLFAAINSKGVFKTANAVLSAADKGHQYLKLTFSNGYDQVPIGAHMRLRAIDFIAARRKVQ